MRTEAVLPFLLGIIGSQKAENTARFRIMQRCRSSMSNKTRCEKVMLSKKFLVEMMIVERKQT